MSSAMVRLLGLAVVGVVVAVLLRDTAMLNRVMERLLFAGATVSTEVAATRSLIAKAQSEDASSSASQHVTMSPLLSFRACEQNTIGFGSAAVNGGSDAAAVGRTGNARHPSRTVLGHSLVIDHEMMPDTLLLNVSRAGMVCGPPMSDFILYDPRQAKRIADIVHKPEVRQIGPIASSMEVQLMYHMLLGNKSEHYDYMQTLPQLDTWTDTLSHLPIAFGDEEETFGIDISPRPTQLAYKDMRHQLLSMQRIQKVYCDPYFTQYATTIMKRVLCDFRLWKWAVAVATSHAVLFSPTFDGSVTQDELVRNIGYTPDQSAGEGLPHTQTFCMLPLVNAFHHDPHGESIKLENLGTKHVRAVVLASSPHVSGNRIGLKLDMDQGYRNSFMRYGIVPDFGGVAVKTPFDAVHLHANKNATPFIQHISDKGCFDLNAYYRVVYKGGEFPARWLDCYRLNNLVGDEWNDEDAPIRADNKFVPFTLANEAAALKALLDDLEALRDGIISTDDEDAQLLTHANHNVATMARLRAMERSVLDEHLVKFKLKLTEVNVLLKKYLNERDPFYFFGKPGYEHVKPVLQYSQMFD